MRTHKISSHGSARTRHDKPWSGFRIRALLAGAASLTLATAGCTSAVTSAGNTPVRGGTAVWAELASTPPNYIFPYESSAYFTLSNANYFANLMYRPLYWFGGNGLPTANNSLSLASPPVFDGTKVTITLKHYRWYNDLSQITPMPAAWDRTASGPSACATTVRDCVAVYNYLNGQSKDLSTYATSPI